MTRTLGPSSVGFAVVGLSALSLVGCGARAEPAATAGGPPPIVLLSMDTFRADRIGAYGNPDGLTPNLDAFAKEAVVFDNVFSQAVQTAPSHSSLFTSRYPTEQVGPDRMPYIPPDQPRLPQLLGLYDYQTAAFVGGGDLHPVRGLNAGFDTYEVSRDFGSFYHSGPMALSWLDTAPKDKPYFLFVHGYDTHAPYLRPPPFGYSRADARADNQGQVAVRTATERIVDGVLYPDFDALMRSFERQLRPRSAEGKRQTAEIAASTLRGEAHPVSEEDLAFVRSVYDGAISYADTMVGSFLAGLESRRVFDDAIVIILSDHGEQLGEHGVFGHCCEANDEETHVPLMVRMPHGEGGGRHVKGLVELVDVMPTILEIVGATPPARIHGQSFAAALHGGAFAGREYVYTEGTELMRTVTMRGLAGRLSYMGLSASQPLLPDLVEAARIDGPGFVATGGLPDAERTAMRTAMVGWLRTLSPPPPPPGKRNELPDSLKKSLREHGYWDVKE